MLPARFIDPFMFPVIVVLADMPVLVEVLMLVAALVFMVVEFVVIVVFDDEVFMFVRVLAFVVLALFAFSAPPQADKAPATIIKASMVRFRRIESPFNVLSDRFTSRA